LQMRLAAMANSSSQDSTTSSMEHIAPSQ
jgi:hypothetical protein